MLNAKSIILYDVNQHFAATHSAAVNTVDFDLFAMTTEEPSRSPLESRPNRFSFGDHVVLLVAEGFGLGRIPKAPGTWGSLWGIPIGYVMINQQWSIGMSAIAAILMLLPGIPLCDKAAKLRNRKDPGSVVWDEMAAFPIVFSLAIDHSWNLWLVLGLGFGLFRLFDIWKPWPVKVFDRIEGGAGIMLDDTVAGVIAAVCLWAAVTAIG